MGKGPPGSNILVGPSPENPKGQRIKEGEPEPGGKFPVFSGRLRRLAKIPLGILPAKGLELTCPGKANFLPPKEKVFPHLKSQEPAKVPQKGFPGKERGIPKELTPFRLMFPLDPIITECPELSVIPPKAL